MNPKTDNPDRIELNQLKSERHNYKTLQVN